MSCGIVSCFYACLFVNITKMRLFMSIHHVKNDKRKSEPTDCQQICQRSVGSLVPKLFHKHHDGNVRCCLISVMINKRRQSINAPDTASVYVLVSGHTSTSSVSIIRQIAMDETANISMDSLDSLDNYPFCPESP